MLESWLQLQLIEVGRQLGMQHLRQVLFAEAVICAAGASYPHNHSMAVDEESDADRAVPAAVVGPSRQLGRGDGGDG